MSLGQEPGNPVTSILVCCHCLPANRAQGNAGPNAPFRPTHRGGRSAIGPTTVRDATQLSKRPCQLRQAASLREHRPIARVARGQRHHRVVSELGTTAGKRLEEGAGRVEAQTTGQHRPSNEWRASGGAHRWRFRDRGRVAPANRSHTSWASNLRYLRYFDLRFYGFEEVPLSASRGQRVAKEDQENVATRCHDRG